jgi:DNA-binding response OmpR family regulator
LQVQGYRLDPRSFILDTPQGRQVRLTPVQFDLLYHLMIHPGKPFSPTRLLDEVWDYPADGGSPDLVRVHIKTLRERVELNPRLPQFIRTVPGFGYVVGSPMDFDGL